MIAIDHRSTEGEKIPRHEHEQKIFEKFSHIEFDWIVLAGYMRVLSTDFINRFRDKKTNVSRIVNIDPSLLPAFPGMNAYTQALRYGSKVTGATVHLVDEELDGGPIVHRAVHRY